MYSFVPFVLLACVNLLLISRIYASFRSLGFKNDTNKQMSANVSVVFLTAVFILFTCPGAISSQYANVLIRTYDGTILLVAGDCLCFSYHALNILILSFTNKKFLKKLKFILRKQQNFSSTQIHLNNSTPKQGTF